MARGPGGASRLVLALFTAAPPDRCFSKESRRLRTPPELPRGDPVRIARPVLRQGRAAVSPRNPGRRTELHKKMSKTPTMKRLTLLAAILALLCLMPLSAWPEEGVPAPPAVPAAQDPLVPDRLPPLILPPLSGEQAEPGEPGGAPPSEPVEDPTAAPVEEPIAQPPAPLPMPKGPAVVRNNLPVGRRYHFALDYDGKLVGYSHFSVDRQLTLGGQSSFLLSSATRIKIGVGGVQDLKFSSQLEVDKKTLAPSSFQCVQKSAEGALQVNCVYSPTMVAQRNHVGQFEQTHFHNFEGPAPHLIFNNLWGELDTFAEHYWLLVRAASTGGVLPAYDPILRGGGQVVVYAPTTESWDWNGRKVATRVYPVTDLKGTLLARVRVLDSNMEPLEIREIGRGLVFRRSDPSIVGRIDKVPGLDLWAAKTGHSNIFFPDPEKLTTLEADVELNLRGGQFADHQISGYRQYFTGQMAEGFMKGRVVVRSVPLEVSRRTPFPLRGEIPTELQAYLQPGPGVESDFVPLTTKAAELTWKAENAFQAARRLNSFVAGEIETGLSLPSARFCLESGVGNAESRALLLVAMARASGLPARRIGGLVFQNGDFVPHHWAEIWLGTQEAWTPFDPTTNEAGQIGASHIALWESGDIQSTAIQVKNYAPRAPRKVAYFNTELAWPVGEQRVYAILRDGERVGTEVARVGDMQFLDNQEVYSFEAQATLQDGEKTLEMKSELLVDPAGLPVRFHMVSGDPAVPVETELRFKADTLHQSVKGGTRPLERDVPFARGTYLTDQRFLTQWALVVGQVPQPKPGDTVAPEKKQTLHVFVPEDLRSRELVLEARDAENLTLADGSEILARKYETEKGMLFFLNDQNQVVKIAIPSQKLEVLLEKTEFRID